jgi:hypothetical protein
MSKKPKKPITRAIWKTMIRRYAIISAIGLVACIYFFRHLYTLSAGQAVPSWVVIGASIGGLMMLGGLFGMALSLFFHLWHKE